MLPLAISTSLTASTVSRRELIQRTRILAMDGTKIRTSAIRTARAVRIRSLLESRFRQRRRVKWIGDILSSLGDATAECCAAASATTPPVSMVFSTAAIRQIQTDRLCGCNAAVPYPESSSQCDTYKYRLLYMVAHDNSNGLYRFWLKQLRAYPEKWAPVFGTRRA